MTGFIYERSPAQKLYDKEVLRRVKRGIALLEKEFGPDWVERLDMESLNLRCGSACVLGQVYRGYDGFCDDGFCDGFDFGADALNLNAEGTVKHGFSVPAPLNGPEWDALQQAWEDELRLLLGVR